MSKARYRLIIARRYLFQIVSLLAFAAMLILISIGLKIGDTAAISIATGFAFVSSIAAAVTLRTFRRRVRLLANKQVFILYDDKDVEIASEITDFLKRKNFNVWLDLDEVMPGQHVENVYDEALSKSMVVVVLLSDAFLKSKKGDALLHLATSKLPSISNAQSPFIPVKIEEVKAASLPQPLRGVSAVRNDAPGRNEMLEAALVAIFELYEAKGYN